MMPGDVPCERPCATRWCIYNQFGVCTDNARCADWTGDAEEGGEAYAYWRDHFNPNPNDCCNLRPLNTHNTTTQGEQP
jgi:hypothetical protein